MQDTPYIAKEKYYLAMPAQGLQWMRKGEVAHSVPTLVGLSESLVILGLIQYILYCSGKALCLNQRESFWTVRPWANICWSQWDYIHRLHGFGIECCGRNLSYAYNTGVLAMLGGIVQLFFTHRFGWKTLKYNRAWMFYMATFLMSLWRWGFAN